jgi:hypothetical protein
MYARDVETLIEDDNKEQVASFHAESVWDKLKHSIEDDSDAKRLSKIMRINQHHFLELFYEIFDNGYPNFLFYYLNPEYAFYRIKDFELDKNDDYRAENVLKEKGDSKNFWNNASRYLAISFESLQEYHIKSNRKWQLVETEEFSFSSRCSEILNDLETIDFDERPKELLEQGIGDERDREKIREALEILMDRETSSKEKEVRKKIDLFFKDLAEVLSSEI